MTKSADRMIIITLHRIVRRICTLLTKSEKQPSEKSKLFTCKYVSLFYTAVTVALGYRPDTPFVASM